MEYRQLGRSGLRVSKVCLGTMVGFKHEHQATATAAIQEAIDLGVNFIDTADVYVQSEEVVGAILAEGGRRDKVVLATKAGWYMGQGPNDFGASRAHLIEACEASLRRLKTDRIDLFMLHVVDINTPLDETLRTLDQLVRQGKVRYIGTSKFPAVLLVEALAASDRLGLERFVSEQPAYNLLDRRAENDLVWTALRHGFGLTPFFPLAQGLLSGKYAADQAAPAGTRMAGKTPAETGNFSPSVLAAVEKLRPLAAAKGLTLAEFSLAWLMQQPAVTAPVVGARTPEYVRSMVKACEIVFTAEELAQIDAVVVPGTHVADYYGANVYTPMRGNYRKGIRGGAYVPNFRL